MSCALAAVPPSRRRRAACATGLLAILLIAVGLLPWVASSPGVVRVLAVLCLVVGLGTGLVAWGLARSATLDLREAAMDAAIAEIAGSCDCGHDHTPPAPLAPACAGDPGCAGSCASCVLSRP